MKSRTVFLDRDGTINVNVEYLDSPEEFQMYSGVPEGIRKLNSIGFKVVVITNQSGIGRGYYTEDVVKAIHKKMIDELGESGAKIDATYYCPHRPEEKCSCRKPEVALFRKAGKELDIDFRRSYVVGDRMMDVIAGHRMGCRTVLVPERGKEEEVELEMRQSDVTPTHVAKDFLSAVEWVVGDAGKWKRKK